jgi:hypothetical protein
MRAAHLPGTLEMLAGVCPPGAGKTHAEHSWFCSAGRAGSGVRHRGRVGPHPGGCGGLVFGLVVVDRWPSERSSPRRRPVRSEPGHLIRRHVAGPRRQRDRYHRFRRIRPGDRLRRRRQRYSRGRDRTTATGPSRAPKLWAATVTAQATSAISPSPMARMAILPTRALATTTSPLLSATTATRPPAADLTPLWSATTTSPPSSTPSAPWAALPSPAKASTSPVVSISLPSSATALTRSRRLLAATSWSRSCRCCSRALRNKARGKRLPDW